MRRNAVGTTAHDHPRLNNDPGGYEDAAAGISVLSFGVRAFGRDGHRAAVGKESDGGGRSGVGEVLAWGEAGGQGGGLLFLCRRLLRRLFVVAPPGGLISATGVIGGALSHCAVAQPAATALAEASHD